MSVCLSTLARVCACIFQSNEESCFMHILRQALQCHLCGSYNKQDFQEKNHRIISQDDSIQKVRGYTLSSGSNVR